jgi:aryl-alcohol dehydrogenase-like predicted oxidoreductase
VIATKVYSRVGPGRNDIGASRGHIMDGVEASLRRLQTDHIDLYQIHDNDSVAPVEETLRALDTLVQQGKVRQHRLLQLAGMEDRQCIRLLRVQEPGPIRHASGLLLWRWPRSRTGNRSLLQSEKIGLLEWSPLAGGLLSGKFSRMNQKPADSRHTDYDFPIVDKERTWKTST